MITKIVIENFKKFTHAEIELGTAPVLFVGQNNGGKTTALQAMSLWSFLIIRWQAEKAGSVATQRTGLPIARNTVTAAPVNNIRMLWHQGDVQDKKSKKINIRIIAYGKNDRGIWEYGMEATFANNELLYAKPLDVHKPVPDEARGIFHLPPISGVQTAELKRDEAAQRQAIGEGRPGEVLRNLLFEVYRDKKKWIELKEGARTLFQVELQDISYNPTVDPIISVNYAPVARRDTKPKIYFEIASAGSGFLQYLLLAAFMHSHGQGAVLLLDEPDSHMHTFLQRNTYDWLQEAAARTQSQLIISTHSEILVNSTGDTGQIVTFFGESPKKVDYDKRLLNDALEEVSPLAVINAEWSRRIFFAEGDTDLRILRVFAEVLQHPVLERLNDPSFFFRPYKTNDITGAMSYFSALKKVVSPALRGFCLRDFHKSEARTQSLPSGFQTEYWLRPEIENYLINPHILLRFIERRLGPLFASKVIDQAKTYLERKLPKAVLDNPLEEDVGRKGSDFLQEFFEAIEFPIYKGSYWEIASVMRQAEVHADIRAMLDRIKRFFDN